MIDPKKPLRFRMPDMRPVRLIGVLHDGDIVIETMRDVAQSGWGEVLQFRPDGFLRYGDGFMLPVLVNDVVVERGFYPMDAIGPIANTRGLTILSGIWSDYPYAKFALEIVRHDGVPKEAKIHARPA